MDGRARDLHGGGATGGFGGALASLGECARALHDGDEHVRGGGRASGGVCASMEDRNSDLFQR